MEEIQSFLGSFFMSAWLIAAGWYLRIGWFICGWTFSGAKDLFLDIGRFLKVHLQKKKQKNRNV